MEIYLPTAVQTEELGKILGRLAESGDVFCLSGDLGTGKTSMSKGIASALGVNADEVNSPTFAIMNIYQGKDLEIRHFDLYRLNRAEELEDIGFDEYCGGDGLTIIEWAELFSDSLPEEYLQIELMHFNEGRKAILSARGQRYEKLIEGVKEFVDFSH